MNASAGSDAGRTVVLTGAAGTVGTAMAHRWAARGDTVVRADLTFPDRLGGLDPDRHPAIACDVSVPADLARLVDTAIHRTGRLDVLVNCAGITHRSPAATTDPDLMARIMAVNWEGPMRLAQLALPHLAHTRGSIVNLSSMSAWMPVLGRAAYGASKAALTQYMEVLRREAAEQGVNVLNVHPSFLDSVMPDHASGEGPGGPVRSTGSGPGPSSPHDAGGQPAMAGPRPRTSVGRPMPVDELADAIVAAELARTRWLFPDRFAQAASLLWRVAPGTFHRLMARRFAAERSDDSTTGTQVPHG